jgi:2-polyprenyl-3-methyl-5-hydroxy-6-metoxy-1,4-benzoquinol methylase
VRREVRKILMKKEIRRHMKNAARALGLNRLFWYVFRLVNEPQESPFLDGSSDTEVFGHFRDSHGKEHPLIVGLRDHLKPKWRTMFQPPAESDQSLSEATVAKGLEAWCRRISKMERFLSMHSVTIKGQAVVEIGAYAGATSFALARAGAAHVSGTDIAAYYIHQTPGEEVSKESVAAKNVELTKQRDSFRQAVAAEIGSRVSFLEDDICSSSLESESADAIVSWEVLEHLKHPARAFEQMFRILKPGGIAFHEYNPFFSQNGGHSLCTLDIPWGHARLSPQDFERYLREIRPSEEEVAKSFYHENLNRMTTVDLRRHVADAGLTPLSIVSWIEPRHFDELTADALSDTRKSYPSCDLMDLISPTVWVLLKK